MFRISFLSWAAIGMILMCCQPPTKNAEKLVMEGTWELLSETKIEKGDTTFTPAAKDQRMIKIINADHFSFLRHDLSGGKDSTAQFVAGGGTYDLAGNVYTEHLQFFILREWEKHDFTFKVSVQNDTLVQQGEEKLEGTDINRYIIERYRRVRN